jgi:hypothetical protein
MARTTSRSAGVREWLRIDPRHNMAVIRVAPDNEHSHGVAQAVGFAATGQVVSPHGERLIRYELPLTRARGATTE